MPARILVVDDNDANLELMRYLLCASGYEVLVASSGAEGLRQALASPDLVICDVQMPGMSGYDLAKQLKNDSRTQRTPLIAVTALAGRGDRDKALTAGFDQYLSKPIDPVSFVGQVEAFLAPELRLAAPVSDSRSGEPLVESQEGRLILIVDNLQENLDFSSSLFAYSGYRTLTAGSHRDALRLTRLSIPDLILSDVCMGEGNGYDFIRDVKADPLLRLIPFVFITSTVDTEKDRQYGLSLGAAKFLFRPIEPDHLLREIQTCFQSTEVS